MDPRPGLMHQCRWHPTLPSITPGSPVQGGSALNRAASHSVCGEAAGVCPATRVMRRMAASYLTLGYLSPSRSAQSGADPATRVRYLARGGLRSDTRSHQTEHRHADSISLWRRRRRIPNATFVSLVPRSASVEARINSVTLSEPQCDQSHARCQTNNQSSSSHVSTYR